MKRKDKLTVLGMALYCAVVFCAFLAWGLKAAPQLSEGDFGRVYAADASEERQPEQTSAQAEICMVDSRAERSGPALCRSTPGGVDRSISGVSDAAAEMPVAPAVSMGVLLTGNPSPAPDGAPSPQSGEGYNAAYDDPDMQHSDPALQNGGEERPQNSHCVCNDQIGGFADERTAVHVIEDCTITYYCCEKRAHICGAGDGITATGAEAMPGVTCAVDPAVIPFGSLVCVDYGDGVLHEYIAQDSGAWVNEDHVDLCVETHSEALALGRKSATVYWSAPNAKPSESGFAFERTSSGMNEFSSLDGNEEYEACEDEATVYWQTNER